MASDDSDDEPLSVLAASKRNDSEAYEDDDKDSDYEESTKKKKKEPLSRKLSVTIKINRKLKQVVAPPVIERPIDVWLYLKDLNPTGPYTCLLCSDWFINRSKMVMHYALNHKKDFCGICRYFVPDREAWLAHESFHTPWPCSQCVETFPTEAILRRHLRTIHNLVHCRLCHFRVPADEQYDTHLFQKHNVTNVACKEEDLLWEANVTGAKKFVCLLCTKVDITMHTFFNHFMGYHHFTLKCLTGLVAGRDPPFTVNGADVSSKFIEDQLKGNNLRFGYNYIEKKTFENNDQPCIDTAKEDPISFVKQENFSDSEEMDKEELKVDKEVEPCNNIEYIKIDYKGIEDFDVTLTEIIILERSYFDYLNNNLKDINLNIVPENSNVDYVQMVPELLAGLFCSLCSLQYESVIAFLGHINKMHSMKMVPQYMCRVCATTFDTQAELKSHIAAELGDFEDLWICQFCDKEFDNREATRKHLTEHWSTLEFDNCFSPHLGFKCKFCPTLFWNEPDREVHQIRVHTSKYKDQFYKCDQCSETYSDKVWFIHHYFEKHFVDGQKYSYLLKCSICCTVVADFDEMRIHFDKNHPEARKLYCSYDTCRYKPLSHRKSFKLHIKAIHGQVAAPRVDKPVNCGVCGREFASSRACTAHMTQVHGPGKFKCKLCREVLNTLDERKLHYLLCHPGRHPFECSECGKSFQYKSSLYMHKQEHAPNKQNYTCSYCGKTFSKKDSFREHVQIHEGPRHACSYCPMRFVQRSNMLRHERRHTGERPYHCTECPRTFADKGACTAHTRTHSRETSFACLYCGQTFVQKSKLTYHIRKHTGENLESCSVCSKLFTSACSLREHMKTHLENRQVVKCPLCDKKYQDERYMLRHLRTSHTRSQFSCPLCQKVVTSSTGLRHHVITHSPLNTFRCKCCPKSYAVKRTIIKHLRKRHNLSGKELNIKDYFTRLDPRDCQLELDEATMLNIFGPPKKKAPDIMLGDFVTIANNFDYGKRKRRKRKASDDTEDDEAKESDKDSDKGSSSSDGNLKISIKQEVQSADEELEPTDFVSVKIEPLEEDGE